MNLQEKAILNAKNILINNYKIESKNKVLAIYDKESNLSNLLEHAFSFATKELENKYESIDFNSNSQEKILKQIEQYNKEDIVILIQSTSFRVSNYRWRNELCNLGFKVIEFGHLNKMDNEVENFIESLTDDFNHYNEISTKLMNNLEKSNEIKIISTDNSQIIFSGAMDKCIRNIGTLWEQTNWTTRYPIGEVITESLDLETLNGEILVYAFPSIDKQITTYVKPFKMKIENGYVTKHEGPKEFHQIIELIKKENDKELIFVRELGMGLNRHIKKDTKLSDPLAYERVEGMHFSIGMKHGMYQKKLWKTWGKKFHQKFHIDVYIDIKEMYIDNQLSYTQEKGYF
jgi:hypothetical protein